MQPGAGRKQLGQTMTEYAIVCVSLVSAFFWAANSECEGYDNCISKLLTVMHDNYDGYSASISAVHQYGELEADVRESTWSDDDDDDSSGGGGSAGGLEESGLTSSTEVTDSLGYESYGNLQDDGTVTNDAGEVVGYYNEDTGTYESVDGDIVDTGAISSEVIYDEEGNILQLRAIVDCDSDPAVVRGFGYQSMATDVFYSSAQLSELEIDGYCTEPSFKVLDLDGNEEAGRIVDGYYYAITSTTQVNTASDGDTPVGEVVYWEDLGICSVMVSGWDASIDTTQSDEDIYADQLALFSEEDEDQNPRIGTQDDEYYVEQVFLYGEDAAENNCVSNRTLVQP